MDISVGNLLKKIKICGSDVFSKALAGVTGSNVCTATVQLWYKYSSVGLSFINLPTFVGVE